MVKVTDKDYYLDGYVKQICDAIANRVAQRKQDILMIIGGQEGAGKTNVSVAIGYYLSTLTDRSFSVDNVFFKIDNMRKFAGSTNKQIIIWDEAALGGLASDWTNFSQRRLKSMLMVCRKKQHIFMFNVPRFYRLNSDIIERAYCMFQIYENKEEKPGCFMFFGRDGLEYLHQDWKKKRKAYYWAFKKFHGFFSWVLPHLIDEEAYEKKKDAAILALANETEKKDKIDKLALQRQKVVENARAKGLNFGEISSLLGIDEKTLRRWRKEWDIRRN